jgi:uncharacterized protein (TIGR03437 family)
LGSGVLAADGTTSISVPAWTLSGGGTGSYTVYGQYSGDVAFSGGGGKVSITLSIPTGGASAIIPSVSNIVVFPNEDSQGLVWQETARIREAAGVPSVLTGFTIDGVDQPVSQYFPSGEIPASTTVSSVTINFRNLSSYPTTKTFGFTGVDVNGNQWSVETTAELLAPELIAGGFTPTLVPLTMTQNTSADPSCQWSQQLFIDEINGDTTTISSLLQGPVVFGTAGPSIASQIPAIFGTTRLFAWNSVSGTLCWSGVTPGASSDLYVGLGVGSVTLQVNFAGPPAIPAQITASPESISMTAPDSNTTATGTFSLTLSEQTQPWTASIFPANRTTGWLTVSQISGTGNAQIKLQAIGTGFEPGAYRATIVFQSPNAIPSTVNVPVMFVLGSGSITGDTAISGLFNAGSLAAAASPGMVALINGSHLANSTGKAPPNGATPEGELPGAGPVPNNYTVDGVSVQVNGVSAPIVAISPSQLTVQIPYEAGAGPAVVGVNNNGQIAGYQFQVAPAAPGIFTDANGFVAGNANAVIGGKVTFTYTGDGDVTPALTTGITPTGTASTPSTYKSRFPIVVSVGGAGVFVNSYGLQPGVLGTTLVNITIPASVPTGVQPVVVTVNGVSSPPAMLNVATQ